MYLLASVELNLVQLSLLDKAHLASLVVAQLSVLFAVQLSSRGEDQANLHVVAQLSELFEALMSSIEEPQLSLTLWK